MKKIEIVTLPGDGIGPEVTAVALNVLQKACEKYDILVESVERDFGGISYENHGTPVTDETIELCKNKKIVLLGAVGGPEWDNLDPNLRPEAALLKLRKELGVFANLRPIQVHESLANSSSLKHDVVSGTDILIVRELTGGVYFGKPRYTSEDDEDPYSVDTMKYSRSEVARVAHEAFKAARLRNHKLCSVDKANVLESSRMWRKTVLEVAVEYPDVELTHMLVDNCAMQLVRNPKQFDVMVTGNLFGDILSDEASMITGSLGMLPSASLGNGNGLYEPVHGSAPDIAGQGVANPLAAVASAALLARYSLNLPDAANDIENAVKGVLESGLRTADLYNEEPGTTLANTASIAQKLLDLVSDTVKA